MAQSNRVTDLTKLASRSLADRWRAARRIHPNQLAGFYPSNQVECREVSVLDSQKEIIMNELVQVVQQKTGLSPEMAQKAVDAVTGYLKTKLPEPMASGLDSLLGGSAGSEAAGGAADDAGGGIMDQAKSMVAGLGGMLGNKDA